MLALGKQPGISGSEKMTTQGGLNVPIFDTVSQERECCSKIQVPVLASEYYELLRTGSGRCSFTQFDATFYYFCFRRRSLHSVDFAFMSTGLPWSSQNAASRV